MVLLFLQLSSLFTFLHQVQIFPLQSGSVRVMFVQPPYCQNCKSWTSEWRKKIPWSCTTLSSKSCKTCLFLDLLHNNTLFSPHAQCLIHTAAQSWLRKQPSAITTAQTGAAPYRKTCACFPGSRLTNHCPVAQYCTWKCRPPPQKMENSTWLFWLRYIRLHCWPKIVNSGGNKRKMQLWCLE